MMLNYFYKPYPSIIEDSYRKSMIINITVSLVIFFILYVFKPTLFFKDSITFSLADSLLFTGITIAISFIYTNILTRIFTKTFDPTRWTVGKEIGFLFGILLTIVLANFIIGREVFYPNQPVVFYTLFQAILGTFLVGVIPMIVVVAFYLYCNQKNIEEKASSINESIQPKTPSEPKNYELNGTGKYEQLEI